MTLHPTRRRRGRGRLAALLALTVTLALAPSAAAAESEASANLSYPVIWSDGAALVAPFAGPPTFTGAFTPLDGRDWYHQRDAGNVWQAETLDALTAGIDGVDVTTVDWGDNLEAKSWSIGPQVRVETVLYQDLNDPEIAAVDDAPPGMLAYTMRQTNVPEKGPDEMWGTDQTTSYSSEAAVYSGCARLTIQRLLVSRADPAVSMLTWNPASGRWDGAGLIAVPLFSGGVWEGGEGTGYAAEVNIQGKVVYGYNLKTTGLQEGHYRLTFNLDPSCPAATLNTFITDETVIKASEEEASILAATPTAEPDMGGGVATIDGTNNLTYIDIELGNPVYAPYVPPVIPPVVTPPADTATPTPPATTPPAQDRAHERTRQRVTLGVREHRVERGTRVRFNGTSSPARDGATVKLQRKLRTRAGRVVYRTVRTSTLREHPRDRSRFAFRIKIRNRGTYRAVVPGDDDHLTGRSRTVRLRVG